MQLPPAGGAVMLPPFQRPSAADCRCNIAMWKKKVSNDKCFNGLARPTVDATSNFDVVGSCWDFSFNGLARPTVDATHRKMQRFPVEE